MKTQYLIGGKYRCECGREFEKSQSLNSHFSRCKIHRGESYTPRSGYAFRNLSDEDKQKIFANNGKSQRGKTLSEEHKHKISQSLKAAPPSENWGGYREGTNKWKGGKKFCKALEKEVWLDSRWELKFVSILEGYEIVWIKNYKRFPYEFEGMKRKYIPDFYLPEFDTWVEVKGWEKPVDKIKWEAFPHFLKIVRGEDLVKFSGLTKEGLVAELVYAHG